MENNERRRPLPPKGKNIELEKFKRRLIRAVARMLLHEKRNEAEVWAGLKAETGCDCKELWNRMHALTIKKLHRLLDAQDRVDMLPRAARMSITDWLLFDMVLVHEDFDVIGMTETSKTDRRVLVDLFDLVEKFKIEFLAGDELADAWSAATLHYNRDNRECTPMLLQRRWYQLKLATRARFYKFWSMYKGVAKKLHVGEPFKPTPLQTAIAKRYKPLVVKPFMVWDELVKNKLVILPEEFDLKSKNLQATAEVNTPDVLCLEPAVETIHLDKDSDSELEYRKPPQVGEMTTIPIKEEPKDMDETAVDESVPYENREERISNFAEAVMEATALELDEMDYEDGVSGFSESKLAEDEITLSEDRGILLEEDNEILSTEAEVRETPNVVENNAELEIAIIAEDNNTSNTIEVLDKNDAAPTTTEKEKYDNEIQSIDDDLQIEENNIEMLKEPEQVLPQITSVFGGIDVSNENLSKIGMLSAQIANSVKKTVITKPETEKSVNDDAPIELSSDSREDFDAETVTEDVPNKDPSAQDSSVKSEAKPEVEIKSELSKMWFGELSNDIHFADDGIQLLDDGIEYNDDECAQQSGEIHTKVKIDIKPELHEDTEDEADNEDTPKIDQKLLMVPVVTSVKLDDMGILPLHLLEHVDNKAIIDIISFKSMPIKQELDIKSESCDEDITQDIKRVKLSSVLLQKPRSRTYNPIQLCKNPDFNTRLKRLNVGFFSSCRNRLLLKACKPLTIDVSKAFENRLVSGTLYLKETTNEDLPKDIDLTEDSQNVSVIPSAMAVQSLIDNTKGDLAPVAYTPAVPDPFEASSQSCERNKVINLPDISEIRRINQRLLTAQVTPLQLENSSPHVPVSIVPSTNTKSVNRYIPGPASRTKMMSKIVKVTDADTAPNSASNTLSSTELINQTKNKEIWIPNEKAVPWKSRQIRPEIPWLSNSYSIYSPDTLLALDTLNKMLYLLTEGETNNDEGNRKKKKKSKGAARKAPPPTKDDNNDDVQVVGETKLDSSQAKICRKGKSDSSNAARKYKQVYCCWARQRICQMIFRKKRISNHNCPFPLCLCCCKAALIEFTKRQEARNASKADAVLSSNKEGVKSVAEINAAKDNKVISADVAEIIPIIEIDSSVPTSDSQLTEQPAQPDCDSGNKNVHSDGKFTKNIRIIVETIVPSNETTDSEPVVPGNKPAVPSNEPAVPSNEPVIPSNEPAVPSNQPAVPSNQPGVPSNEPAEGEPTIRSNEAAEGEPAIRSYESTVDDVVVSSNESIIGEQICDELTVAEVVVCSDQSNVSAAADSSNKSAQLSQVTLDTNESCQNEVAERVIEIDCTSDDVLQEADVSLVPLRNCASQQSVESAITEKPIANINVTAVMRPPPPPRKQRFRVKPSTNIPGQHPITRNQNNESHFYRGQQLVANPTNSIRVTAGIGKKIVIIDPTKLNRVEKGDIHVRKNNSPNHPPTNQNTEVNDTTKSNTKTYVNQKMIYLNSKQIAELPSDNPIFLGKNKILLTTAKFPPNFKAFEAFQRSIKQTLAIPKGIQLILQPNGRLTYIRDAKAVISDEFMATLPHLIEAIQQQINSSVIAPITVQQSSDSLNEVINLSDDESDVIESSDKSSGEESKSNKDQPTCIENTTSKITAEPLATAIQTENLNPIKNMDHTTGENANTPTEGNVLEPNQITDNSIPENTNTSVEENSQVPITNSDNLIGDNINTPVGGNIEEPLKSTSQSIGENTNTSTEENTLEPIKSTDSIGDNTNTQTDGNIQVSEEESVTIANVEEETKKTNTNENCVTPDHSEAADEHNGAEVKETKSMDSTKNTKNILSDLMAMSGIGPVDISSTFEESLPAGSTAQEPSSTQGVQRIIQPPLLQPISANLQHDSLLHITHTTKELDKNKMLTHALTAISSLSELKYACSQNGTFFKLDLETGLLLPINVCMKTLNEAQAAGQRVPLRRIPRHSGPSRFTATIPKPVIDLTDDDILEVTDLTETRTSKSLLISNQPPCKNSEETGSDGEGTYNNRTSSITISPNDGEVKPLKLFKSSVGRPNILERKLKEIQKRISDAMTAQDVIRRKLKRKQELRPISMSLIRGNTSDPGDSDCSSDEEPLAKIATKIRATEKKAAECSKKNGEEGVLPVTDVSESEVIPVDNTMDAVDENADVTLAVCDEPMDDELEMEYLDEESLEENGEEDCILGV